MPTRLQKLQAAFADKELTRRLQKEERQKELAKAEAYRKKYGRNPPAVLFPSND